MSALGFNCGQGGCFPSRLVCETNLPERRDRKIPTDLNQKTKTKNHCVLGTKLRLEQGRPRHFGKNHNLPYERSGYHQQSVQLD
jgi:hypothetical protein